MCHPKKTCKSDSQIEQMYFLASPMSPKRKVGDSSGLKQMHFKVPFSSFKSHKSDKLKPGNSQEEYICDFVESSILQKWLQRSYHYCPHYFVTPPISFRS